MSAPHEITSFIKFRHSLRGTFRDHLLSLLNSQSRDDLTHKLNLLTTEPNCFHDGKYLNSFYLEQCLSSCIEEVESRTLLNQDAKVAFDVITDKISVYLKITRRFDDVNARKLKLFKLFCLHYLVKVGITELPSEEASNCSYIEKSWLSMLGLLYVIVGTFHFATILAREGLLNHVDVLGYAASQLGYVFAVAAAFRGSFNALFIRGRVVMILLSLLMLTLGFVVLNR